MTDHVDKSCINGNTLFWIASSQLLKAREGEGGKWGVGKGEGRRVK